MVEAGLIERFREGSWAFFRLAEHGGAADLARTLVARLDPADPIMLRDRERLAAVRQARADAAQKYFSEHAAEWDRIRKLHVADAAVEKAIGEALGDRPFRALLDLGTGTGRMLELFGPKIERGLGIDLSLDMLSLARARIERAGLKHCSVRQGDIYDLALPPSSFDAVVIHQVLHYLDDGARAIREAARILEPAGRLLVIDFAPHDLEFLREEHAHRRLGFPPETVTQWMTAAGLDLVMHRSLLPELGSDGKIAVSLWLGRDRRAAKSSVREVA
jgi:ubiquinone/menaquinone biosynthesis C-methylase UbiE